jgi:hypothetical protein
MFRVVSTPEVTKYNEEGNRLVLEATNSKFAYYGVFVPKNIFTSLVSKAQFSGRADGVV